MVKGLCLHEDQAEDASWVEGQGAGSRDIKQGESGSSTGQASWTT